jgi:hypothetical protein
MEHRKTELSKKLMIEALKKYRGLMKNPPTDSDIETYAEVLSVEFEFKQITTALSYHMKSGGIFFPSCGEIFSILSAKDLSPQERSPLIAKEIIQFLRTHHFDLEQDYLHTLSDDAREVFLAIGNSSDLRNSENFEVMNAQLERFIKGFLAVKGNHQKNDRLVQIGALKNNAGLRSLDFSSFAVESTHD